MGEKEFNTKKELNRKIKDFETGNLKTSDYCDLINHLIDYVDFLQKLNNEEKRV